MCAYAYIYIYIYIYILHGGQKSGSGEVGEAVGSRVGVEIVKGVGAFDTNSK
jgi:hypothetical protein